MERPLQGGFYAVMPTKILFRHAERNAVTERKLLEKVGIISAGNTVRVNAGEMAAAKVGIIFFTPPAPNHFKPYKSLS